MDKTDLSEKEFLSMTKMIKIISESIKEYIENSQDTVHGKDDPLYAMQVLSLICGLNRGYTKTQMDQMWAMSVKVSNKLHAASKSDKVETKFQGSTSSQYLN